MSNFNKWQEEEREQLHWMLLEQELSCPPISLYPQVKPFCEQSVVAFFKIIESDNDGDWR